MSYLVLARKWRPQNFEEVIGQDHVVRTLSHALNNERLHHAYLFTGTRGVGKTTIARILAKALNCEQGISSKPCNQCDACAQVDLGGYIDLIEVDAASKTKVEDTRALLDNVPYQPSVGRYKIYLFDEIHMLSGHSFNAFLKTLEEPPGHVKFLMATTDPQKLPVTVLSRCIQFNLRAMDTEEISEQLVKILTEEGVDYESDAINAIARLAYGSMRDALSIVDQAISYTQGNLQELAVREMLGMLSRDYIYAILLAVARQQADEVLKIIANMFERSINLESALDDLLLRLHELGLHKVAAGLVESRSDNVDQLKELSSILSAEEIQLYYQIGLLGKRDLELAPTPRIGFEMILLRMIAFHPDSRPALGTTTDLSGKTNQTKPVNKPAVAPGIPAQPAKTAPESSIPTRDISNSEDWLAFVQTSSALKGIVKNFASKVSFESRDGNKISLVAPVDAGPSLMRPENETQLEKILSDSIGQNIELRVTKGKVENPSLQERSAQARNESVNETIKQIEQEEIPKILQTDFGAIPDADSVRLPSDNSD